MIIIREDIFSVLRSFDTAMCILLCDKELIKETV